MGVSCHHLVHASNYNKVLLYGIIQCIYRRVICIAGSSVKYSNDGTPLHYVLYIKLIYAKYRGYKRFAHKIASRHMAAVPGSNPLIPPVTLGSDRVHCEILCIS